MLQQGLGCDASCRWARKYQEVALCDEPFVLRSADHPKADWEEVFTEDLEGEEVLLLEDGHCFRDQALEVCQAHHGIESKNFSATSLETLRQLVAAGVGVTLIPQLAVPADAAKEGPVRYIPFTAKGSNSPRRTLGLCWRTTSTRRDLLEQAAIPCASAWRIFREVRQGRRVMRLVDLKALRNCPAARHGQCP